MITTTQKKTTKTLTEKSKTKTRMPSLRTMQVKADSKFSIFIRKRDSYDGEYGACVTCGVVKPIKEMDCGHYITRKILNTRYDETNCSLQCKSCNGFYEGRKPEHGIALEMKYGDGKIEELILKSKKLIKITAVEYQAIIDYYNDKVKELDMYKLYEG